ncbi:pilus assembly protein PilZ [Sphingomonas sp. MMSM24]|uniref:Pilus assembly protein PilZ n=2 Tax=Sphingomonadaceae TaxID=41297 RepID=A0AA41ZB47_9SPHN|nr:pilus assembly protein PilZ [Sphingomonas lycopersici]MCW6537262.1 pilus assembly protein PilZ [Sphingomonas lycopersici]OJU19628.1 MAG: pilus assembly protein PilZ [Sphingomonas sp. 66-10]
MEQVVPIPASQEGEESRLALRKAVKMRAHLRDRGTTRFEIEVVDLSTTGFRAHTSFTMWPGQTVWLTLPGLAALEAVVAWRDKFKYGCAFAKPLHPAVFDHIVALGNS